MAGGVRLTAETGNSRSHEKGQITWRASKRVYGASEFLQRLEHLRSVHCQWSSSFFTHPFMPDRLLFRLHCSDAWIEKSVQNFDDKG